MSINIIISIQLHCPHKNEQQNAEQHDEIRGSAVIYISVTSLGQAPYITQCAVTRTGRS